MPAGPRIRGNNSFGVTTDAPLTAGATTFNSAGLATLPVVSAAHAVVVLDPKRVNGEPEIVVVTSHSALATVATITRGQYGTVARSHPVGTPWAHAPIDEDYIEILTANPTNPYEGQLWYRSDTDIYMAYNGSAAVEALPIGAWQTWVPILTQGGVVASTTVFARWTRVGRGISGQCRLTATASGTATNPLTVSLPVPALVTATSRIVGTGWIVDVSTATYVGVWNSATPGTAADMVSDSSTSAGNPWGVAPNVAIASGDVIALNLNYEAVA